MDVRTDPGPVLLGELLRREAPASAVPAELAALGASEPQRAFPAIAKDPGASLDLSA